MGKQMAKMTRKNDKKHKKAIERRESGERLPRYADPHPVSAEECDCVWQTKETTLTAKHTVYLRQQGTQTV